MDEVENEKEYQCPSAPESTVVCRHTHGGERILQHLEDQLTFMKVRSTQFMKIHPS
jgi:hypothetical protein